MTTDSSMAVSMISRDFSIGMSAFAPFAPLVNVGFVPRGRLAL
jgi:hypothetical protein